MSAPSMPMPSPAETKAAAELAEVKGGLHDGQTVRLHGLQARADLNGEVGCTERFDKAGRWHVRLRSGVGVRVKSSNLEVAL
jgi:hypothetical protein